MNCVQLGLGGVSHRNKEVSEVVGKGPLATKGPLAGEAKPKEGDWETLEEVLPVNTGSPYSTVSVKAIKSKKDGKVLIAINKGFRGVALNPNDVIAVAKALEDMADTYKDGA